MNGSIQGLNAPKAPKMMLSVHRMTMKDRPIRSNTKPLGVSIELIIAINTAVSKRDHIAEEDNDNGILILGCTLLVPRDDAR